LSTTTGAECQSTESDCETHFRVNAYFKILDAVIVNMEKRFSIESLQMASAVDNFLKLNTNESKFFIEHYQVCTI